MVEDYTDIARWMARCARQHRADGDRDHLAEPDRARADHLDDGRPAG